MRKSVWIALSVLLFALPVNAAVQRKEGTREGKPYLEMTDDRVMTATIVSVNHKTRVVKVRNEAGETLTVTAGPEVKNLASVKKNDTVKIHITERATIEVANEVAKDLEEKDSKDVSVKTAKEGEEPHGTVTEHVRRTATIESIDKVNGTVTLRGQDGNSFTAKPKRKSTLDQLKVGDKVIFTATKTTATSVARAGGK